MDQNLFIVWLLRSPLGRWMGNALMLVTYTGRKTGRKIRVPVNFVRSGEELLVTSRRDRHWWRNFRGGNTAQLRIQGKTHPAQGQVLEDPGMVAEKLGIYLAAAPGAARYFNVILDEQGRFSPESLVEAARHRVIVVFRLDTPAQ